MVLLRGLPDWSVADQLVPDGDLPYDPTLCTSCAEALAKGIIFLHHPNRMVQYDQARRCKFFHSLPDNSQGIDFSGFAFPY